jgi:hypothetical protein
MNGAAQLADTFAVDNPDLKNSALAAGREVIWYQFANVLRSEGMQIQNAVDR